MEACIILLRHAERLDRAMEDQGLDWIQSAPFPQDPPLSDFGCQQAHGVGMIMKNMSLTHIYSSPMIRTVMTSAIISNHIVPPLPLWIENGLIEEAKSFRGRTPNEPKPVWIDGKVHQSPSYLKDNISDLVDLSHSSLQEVTHSPDHMAKNEIRENHETLLDAIEITRDRCSQFISKLMKKHQGSPEGFRILCVGHGATCSGCSRALEEGLPDDLKIRGERLVGCWARYIPLDESNLNGPWYSPEGVWQSLGTDGRIASENVADRGIEM